MSTSWTSAAEPVLRLVSLRIGNDGSRQPRFYASALSTNNADASASRRSSRTSRRRRRASRGRRGPRAIVFAPCNEARSFLGWKASRTLPAQEAFSLMVMCVDSLECVVAGGVAGGIRTILVYCWLAGDAVTDVVIATNRNHSSRALKIHLVDGEANAASPREPLAGIFPRCDMPEFGCLGVILIETLAHLRGGHRRVDTVRIEDLQPILLG
ncbi:hypothetical protein BDZ89DRAFT_1213476 [Hymenopellis radicata]|nr:hypothetical protein BDZ89DRAFT_1213476 [Hymenopellis radicata]